MAPALLLLLLVLEALGNAASANLASVIADARGRANVNALGRGSSALDQGALLNENALEGLVNTNIYGTDYGRYSSVPYGQANVNILGRSVYANENTARAIANANAVSRAIANANALGYGAIANANAVRAITNSNSIARTIANANAKRKVSNANIVSYRPISKTDEAADITNTNPFTQTISNINSASGFQQFGVPEVKTVKHVKTAQGLLRSPFKTSGNTVVNANSVDSLKHFYGLSNDAQTKANIAQSSRDKSAFGNGSIKLALPAGFNILSFLKSLGYNSLENIPWEFLAECLGTVYSIPNPIELTLDLTKEVTTDSMPEAINITEILQLAESNGLLAHAIPSANANALNRLSHANAVSHGNAALANVREYANALAYDGGIKANTDRDKHHDVHGVVYTNPYVYGRLGTSNAFQADTHDVHGAIFPNSLLYGALANANSAQVNNHKPHNSVYTNSFGHDDNTNVRHSDSHDERGVVNANSLDTSTYNVAHDNNHDVHGVQTNTFDHDSSDNSNAGYTNKHNEHGDIANTLAYDTYGIAHTGHSKPDASHYYSHGDDAVSTKHPVFHDRADAATAVGNSNAFGGGAAFANAIVDDRLTSTAGGHDNLEDGVTRWRR